MPKRCIVEGCSNVASKEISLHHFPKNEQMRKLWSSKIKQTRANWTGPTDYSVVCSQHFDTDSDFECGLYEAFNIGRRRSLRPDAVPKIEAKRSGDTTSASTKQKKIALPTDPSKMRKFQNVMSGGPQPTKQEGCQTDCLPVRGENTEDDCRDDSEAEEIRGEPEATAKADNRTVFIKEECLEDDYGEGEKPGVIPTELQETENIEYQTESMKEDQFEDEWIEDDKSEERPPVDEEVLPYHAHIKEEVLDDGYPGDDTTDMTAHSSYTQDGSSSMENSNNIVISTQVFSRAQKDGRLRAKSKRKRTVSEENLPSRSVSSKGDRSISSTHRPNQKDYFQVVCAEEVDTMDQDFNDEDGQIINIPGEMCFGEEMHQDSCSNTRFPDGTNAREQMFDCPDCHKSDNIRDGTSRRQPKKKRPSRSPSEDSQDTLYSEEEVLEEHKSVQRKSKKTATRKKQTGPRNVYKMEDVKLEEEILEWMQDPENDFLWNSRRTDYRFPEKKRARFLEKETSLNLEEGFLSKWFGGLRDSYTKLHKRTSGNGSAMFTERQQWVLNNLKFFNKLVAHRSYPVKSFTPVVAEHTTDLEAMEKAAADQAIKEALDEERAQKDKKEKQPSPEGDDTELAKLRKRQKDFDDIITTLQTKLSEPETVVSAYAMYLKTTLQSMKRSKFKKARKAINRALEPFLDSSDEDSNEESQPGFPSMAPLSNPMSHP